MELAQLQHLSRAREDGAIGVHYFDDAQIQILGDRQVVLKILGHNAGVQAQHGVGRFNVLQTHAHCVLLYAGVSRQHFPQFPQDDPQLL